MANIIPFIRFTALENVKFVGFSSIVGITNIVTMQTGYDDLESIACQLGDGRWIIVVWNRDEDQSTAYPAYYSELSNGVASISAPNIEYELEQIDSSNVDSIKKQVEQWLPHLTDEELVSEVSQAIHGETNHG